MEFTLFSDDWYAKYMNQVQSGFGDKTSDDARAIATAIMTAGAFIAQSIDNSIGRNDSPDGGNLTDQISNLASTLWDIHRGKE